MKKITFLISFFLLIGAGCSNIAENQNYTNINSADIEPLEKQTMETEKNENRIQAVIQTNQGEITLELFNDKSPKTVENFVKLAKDGFYDNTRFHRVIEDFMIQGGDPLSKDLSKKDFWGQGGPGYMFDDEFNNEKLVRGSLAMANSGKNTNGSQFFIVTKESTPWLNGKHTNFGKVISGMEVVEKIEKTKVDSADRPIQDVLMKSIEINK